MAFGYRLVSVWVSVGDTANMSKIEMSRSTKDRPNGCRIANSMLRPSGFCTRNPYTESIRVSVFGVLGRPLSVMVPLHKVHRNLICVFGTFVGYSYEDSSNEAPHMILGYHQGRLMTYPLITTTVINLCCGFVLVFDGFCVVKLLLLLRRNGTMSCMVTLWVSCFI